VLAGQLEVNFGWTMLYSKNWQMLMARL
jgi:hypothetical protein